MKDLLPAYIFLVYIVMDCKLCESTLICVHLSFSGHALHKSNAK